MAYDKAHLAVGVIYISRLGVAHLTGPCLEGRDLSQYGVIDTRGRGAWLELGKGKPVQATRGNHPDRIATSRCRNCARPFTERGF